MASELYDAEHLDADAVVPFTVFISSDDLDSVSVADSDITTSVAIGSASWDEDFDELSASRGGPNQIDAGIDDDLRLSPSGPSCTCAKELLLVRDEERSEVEDVHYSATIQDGTRHNEMGTRHLRRGNYRLALEAYDAALRSFRFASERECANPNEAHQGRGVAESSSRAIAGALRNIAAVYWRVGDFDLSAAYLKDALCIQEDAAAALKDDDECLAEVARTLLKLGTIECLRGKYAKAMKALKRARRILEDAYGPAHIDIAEINEELGKVHFVSGATEDALKCHCDALEIKRGFLEPQHPSVVSSMMNVAHVHRKRGNFNEAEKLYRRVLRAQKTALSESWDQVHQRAILAHVNQTLRLMKQVQRERECHRVLATLHLGGMETAAE